jgi:hypothetical protein
MLIGLAMIESLCMYALVISLMLLTTKMPGLDQIMEMAAK